MHGKGGADRSTDDFEVGVFLTDLSTRHSLLTKQKRFLDKPRLRSNSSKLTGWLGGTGDAPINVDDERAVDTVSGDNRVADAAPVLIREESDDETDLSKFANASSQARPKRKRESAPDDEDALFVDDDDAVSQDGHDEADTATERSTTAPLSAGRTRNRRGVAAGSGDADQDEKKDKKKMRTLYEGFSIYGRILCLVVKRRGGRAIAAPSGQQIMEQFVSTQAAGEQTLEDA